jgi:hypothetical protein
VDVAALENGTGGLVIPVQFQEREYPDVLKVIQGLGTDDTQLVLDALAWKLEVEGIKYPIRMLGWMVSKMKAGELDVKPAMKWREKQGQEKERQRQSLHMEVCNMVGELEHMRRLVQHGADFLKGNLTELETQYRKKRVMLQSLQE